MFPDFFWEYAQNDITPHHSYIIFVVQYTLTKNQYLKKWFAFYIVKHIRSLLFLLQIQVCIGLQFVFTITSA